MLKQEVSISSFQKNVTKLLDVVLSGDEIIITKSNIPIAKVTPINDPKIILKNDFITASAINSRRAPSSEAPENWFG